MARIVFSGCHNEYLRIGKPGTSFIGPRSGRFDWVKLAKLLVECGFDIALLDGGIITRKSLEDADILVLGQPESHFYHSKPAKKREPEDPDKWGILRPSEIKAIEGFVAEGGGLLIVQEKHPGRRGNNLNELSTLFGITFEDDLVECDDHYGDDQGWVFVIPKNHPLFEGGIEKLVYFDGCSLVVKEADRAVGYSSGNAEPPNAPLIVASTYKKGKVVAIGDATLFSEWGLGPTNEFREQHARFVFNLFAWLTPEVYRQKEGVTVDASIRETTSDIITPITLREISCLSEQISSISKQLDDQEFTKQKENISRLLQMLRRISAKIGAGRPPIVQSILITVSEFFIVVAGFMLAYILTQGIQPVSLNAIMIMLVLSLVVVFLLKVIEFWKRGER